MASAILDFPCPLEAVINVMSPKSNSVVYSKHLKPVRVSFVIVKPLIFCIILVPFSEEALMPPLKLRCLCRELVGADQVVVTVAAVLPLDADIAQSGTRLDRLIRSLNIGLYLSSVGIEKLQHLTGFAGRTD